MPQETIKLREALKRMRALSEINVPFSITFATYSEETQSSNGYKTVNQALIRPGYRENQSDYHNMLIAYSDYDNKESNRQFYVAILLIFNNYIVIP
jgi:hypothetical protein